MLLKSAVVKHYENLCFIFSMNQGCSTTTSLITCQGIAESKTISLSETRKDKCGFWLKLCYSNQSFGLAGVPCGMGRWYLQAANQVTYRSGI